MPTGTHHFTYYAYACRRASGLLKVMGRQARVLVRGPAPGRESSSAPLRGSAL